LSHHNSKVGGDCREVIMSRIGSAMRLANAVIYDAFLIK